MKANELRLGNLIEVKCIAGQAKGLDDWDAQPLNIHNLTGILNNEPDFLYRGIPLTEEWLTNFGFALRENWYHKRFQSYHGLSEASVNLTSKYAAVSDTDDEGVSAYLGWEIKYVHRLQNLYFALTGQELPLISNSDKP